MITEITAKNICQMTFNFFQCRYDLILEEYYDNNSDLLSFDEFTKNHQLDLINQYLIRLSSYLNNTKVIDVDYLQDKFIHEKHTKDFIIECQLFNNGCLVVSLKHLKEYYTFYFNIELKKNYFKKAIEDKSFDLITFEKSKINYMSCY